MCVNKFNFQNVYAGNEERWSITGWVNTKKDAQEHVKRISPCDPRQKSGQKSPL